MRYRVPPDLKAALQSAPGPEQVARDEAAIRQMLGRLPDAEITLTGTFDRSAAPGTAPANIRVADRGPFLATRASGTALRELAGEPGTPVVLDFAGVAGITVSFGDELAGKLVAEGGRDVTVTGMCAEVADVMALVFARRGITADRITGNR